MDEAELSALSASLPSDRVLSLTSGVVKVRLGSSAYKQLTLTLRALEGYPRRPLVPELSSASLPPPLLEKLTLALEKEAATHAGGTQLVEAVTALQRLLDANRLLTAWEEIRQARQLLEAEEVGELKLSEKAGRVTLRAGRAGHTVDIAFVVPEAYPAQPVVPELKRTTFPNVVASYFVAKLTELARRLADGFEPEPTGRPAEVGGEEARQSGAHYGERAKELTKLKTRMAKDDVSVDLSSRGIHELKSDTEFLHQFANVRDNYDQRKERRRLVHIENKHDTEVAQAKRMQHVAQGREPRYSLLPAIRMVVEQWVIRISREPCQLCERLVIPAPADGQEDRAVGGDVTGTRTDGTYQPHDPMRTLCGHWYHFGCLDPHMTSPPFDKKCQACGKPIEHAHWTKAGKRALLEKRWAFEEARKREVGDVSDFLGF
eukprot:scaffold9424_cov27-Tisochrysis_lutea.AAC.2